MTTNSAHITFSEPCSQLLPSESGQGVTNRTPTPNVALHLCKRRSSQRAPPPLVIFLHSHPQHPSFPYRKFRPNKDF